MTCKVAVWESDRCRGYRQFLSSHTRGHFSQPIGTAPFYSTSFAGRFLCVPAQSRFSSFRSEGITGAEAVVSPSKPGQHSACHCATKAQKTVSGEALQGDSSHRCCSELTAHDSTVGARTEDQRCWEGSFDQSTEKEKHPKSSGACLTT